MYTELTLCMWRYRFTTHVDKGKGRKWNPLVDKLKDGSETNELLTHLSCRVILQLNKEHTEEFHCLLCLPLLSSYSFTPTYHQDCRSRSDFSTLGHFSSKHVGLLACDQVFRAPTFVNAGLPPPLQQHLRARNRNNTFKERCESRIVNSNLLRRKVRQSPLLNLILQGKGTKLLSFSKPSRRNQRPALNPTYQYYLIGRVKNTAVF